MQPIILKTSPKRVGFALSAIPNLDVQRKVHDASTTILLQKALKECKNLHVMMLPQYEYMGRGKAQQALPILKVSV